jgi:hypothetical protein
MLSCELETATTPWSRSSVICASFESSEDALLVIKIRLTICFWVASVESILTRFGAAPLRRPSEIEISCCWEYGCQSWWAWKDRTFIKDPCPATTTAVTRLQLGCYCTLKGLETTQRRICSLKRSENFELLIPTTSEQAPSRTRNLFPSVT